MKHPTQEPNTVPGGLISAVIAGTIVVIVISLVIMRRIETWRTGVLHSDSSAAAEQMKDLPQEVSAIETRPFSVEARGIDDNAAAERVLTSYAWVDRTRGIMRVPIEVAFDVYLARTQAPTPVARRSK